MIEEFRVVKLLLDKEEDRKEYERLKNLQMKAKIRVIKDRERFTRDDDLVVYLEFVEIYDEEEAKKRAAEKAAQEKQDKDDKDDSKD